MNILGNLIDIIEGVPAVNLAAGANNGDYISLKNAQRAAVVFVSGVGSSGEDPTLKLQQAKTVAGGSVKDFNFTTIYTKQAATSLASTTKWTEVTQTADEEYTHADAAEQSLIWVVEIDPAALDTDNDFNCIRATVADVGSGAQSGYLFYLVVPKTKGDPTDPPSYIAD